MGADPDVQVDLHRQPGANAQLSRLMFEAREVAAMFADVIEARGLAATYERQLVEAIDAYRAEQGWSPHGFGGET